MPELPEVETARRGIAEQLVGRRLTGYQLWLPQLIVSEAGLSLDRLVGTRLEDARRYGKYLLLVFEPFSVIVHLKLAGQLVGRGSIPGFAAGHPIPAHDAELPHKSTHLRLDFEGDAHLFLTDIRHFGRVWLVPHEAVPAHLEGLKLGPDVLPPHFTLKLLKERLSRRGNSRLKPALLDQSVVAGLGNIYVDESLWQAKLHPERLVGSLREAELRRLYKGITTTMEHAIPIGGARIVHTTARSEHGDFPFVHGREDLPCPRCGTTVVKTRVNSRGTYLCPRCQPTPS